MPVHTRMKNITATPPSETPLSHGQFKAEMDSALAEIEQAANAISDLGGRRLSKLSNTFVLLTCLGFVPSAMANLDYLEEPKMAFIFCVTVLAASSVYGLYYIVQYCLMPELLRSIAIGLIRSVDTDDDDDNEEQEEEEEEDEKRDRREQQQRRRRHGLELPINLKMALLQETRATAKEANKTYESLYQRRNYIDGSFQVAIGIISFVLMILILVGKKTDEFGMPALAELIFTVWIFFANIAFALLYAFISTRKRRKDMEAAEKIAEKVAKDWLTYAQRIESTGLWQKVAEQHQTPPPPPPPSSSL